MKLTAAADQLAKTVADRIVCVELKAKEDRFCIADGGDSIEYLRAKSSVNTNNIEFFKLAIFLDEANYRPCFFLKKSR
ncbi:MAG: hypothetical protein EBW14_07905 [Oxalobacteraceae bacterium]|nr:hypothetical protein [Oxalobacteraceae bacterium]